jgi:hypothetical protein
MLFSIWEAIIQFGMNIGKRHTFQAHSYFSYFFVSLGIIWFGVASYYYLNGRIDNCLGAAVTSGLFLLLWLSIVLFNMLMKKFSSKNNVLDKLAKSALLFCSSKAIKAFSANTNITRKIMVTLIVGMIILVLCKYSARQGYGK